MSVFRIEKTKNYTVMSNYHLRDKALSLKCKGLLSIMLSLPEDWDYTEVGLSKITGEGRDSIRSCLKQLEKNGYLIRHRLRDEKGHMTGTEYIIYEHPRPMSENPTLDKPILENPVQDAPTLADPTLGKHTQLNTKEQNTEKNKDTDLSINRTEEKDGWKTDPAQTYLAYKKVLEENTGFAIFQQKRKQLDQEFEANGLTMEAYEEQCSAMDPVTAEKVIGYMLDLLCSRSKADVMINGDLIPREIVKKKLLEVDHLKLKAVVKELNTNPSVRNPKAYAISMLYNASITPTRKGIGAC